MVVKVQIGRTYRTRGGDCVMAVNPTYGMDGWVHVQKIGICGSYFVRADTGRCYNVKHPNHDRDDDLVRLSKPFLSASFNKPCVQVECLLKNQARQLEKEQSHDH